MTLRPVYCTHKGARPPKGTPQDAEGRYRIAKGVLPSAVVTAPWCASDHYPDN